MKPSGQLVVWVWLFAAVHLLGGCASEGTDTRTDSAAPQPWSQTGGSGGTSDPASDAGSGAAPPISGAGASGPGTPGLDAAGSDTSQRDASGSDVSASNGGASADSSAPVSQDSGQGQSQDARSQDAGGQDPLPEAGSDTGSGQPGTVLDHYVATSDPFFVVGSGNDNLSGITWNPDTGSYFGVINNSGLVYEITEDLTTTTRSIQITGFDLDYEAITYLGGNEYALVRESNAMIIVTIAADTATVGDGAQQLVFAPPPALVNSGAEAIAFDPATGSNGRFWVMQELSPMRVFQFDRPADGLDHSYDGDLVVTEPFDPEQTLSVSDISDAVFDPRTGHLLILSHESYCIVEVAPGNGQPLARLELPRQFTDRQAKWEGIALGPLDVIALVSEGLGAQFNRAQMYAYQP